MALVNLKIVQHSVLNWKNHRVNLINIYNEIKPDVILLNSHGNKSNEKIKIYNYVTYQSNKLEERNNGCAIAVRLGNIELGNLFTQMIRMMMMKICNKKISCFFFFFFFLDLLKEVESSLRTNRDCLASLKCRTPCQNRHDYRLNHPPRKTRPKTT